MAVLGSAKKKKKSSRAKAKSPKSSAMKSTKRSSSKKKGSRKKSKKLSKKGTKKGGSATTSYEAVRLEAKRYGIPLSLKGKKRTKESLTRSLAYRGKR